MDTNFIRNKFHACRVRKLIGKPVATTPPDCEFDARRIQIGRYEICLSFLAVNSKALRIHSDLLCGDLAIAACITRFSSWETLACIKMPLYLALGTVGLPIFGVFINSFCMTKKMLTDCRLCHTFSQH